MINLSTTFDSYLNPSKTLTRRELEVLTAMAEGLSNKLIADKLDMSDHTAKFHVRNVCEKLECDTRTGAVAKAIRAGIV
jgi:DNA-binding NarL/FixJ family response regulator